jgi:hypothetical protein
MIEYRYGIFIEYYLGDHAGQFFDLYSSNPAISAIGNISAPKDGDNQEGLLPSCSFYFLIVMSFAALDEKSILSQLQWMLF